MAVSYAGREIHDLEKADAQAGTTLALCALGIWVLFQLARPLDRVRLALVLAMIAGTVIAFTVPFMKDFFELAIPSAEYLLSIGIIVAIGATLIEVALRITDRPVPLTATPS
jgi:cation-transporting ATPase E